MGFGVSFVKEQAISRETTVPRKSRGEEDSPAGSRFLLLGFFVLIYVTPEGNLKHGNPHHDRILMFG